jgi:hypothetical protein
MNGVVLGVPRFLIRAENLAIMVGAAVAYEWLDASWWLFALLFLVPDISMVGYLHGPRVGAAVYNAGHWYGLPIALITFGFYAHTTSVVIGLIWIAHIGFDRALGFGLKYPGGFKATHLKGAGESS